MEIPCSVVLLDAEKVLNYVHFYNNFSTVCCSLCFISVHNTGHSSLLLSLCDVQKSAPSGETAMCVMAAPRRGRKSRWFSWLYRHWTSTDSKPPLSRLVPDKTKQKQIQREEQGRDDFFLKPRPKKHKLI